MNKEELLYNEIYERTKDFGRTHFIKEIMRLQREKQELEQKLRMANQMNVDTYNKYCEEIKENKQLKSVLEEVRGCIKKEEFTDIKGNTLYCEENKIWHKLLNILDKVKEYKE